MQAFYIMLMMYVSIVVFMMRYVAIKVRCTFWPLNLLELPSGKERLAKGETPQEILAAFSNRLVLLAAITHGLKFLIIVTLWMFFTQASLVGETVPTASVYAAGAILLWQIGSMVTEWVYAIHNLRTNESLKKRNAHLF